jgi:hypothetical protein
VTHALLAMFKYVSATSGKAIFVSCLQRLPSLVDWQKYFDISLFNAKKPAFFTDGNSFLELGKSI